MSNIIEGITKDLKAIPKNLKAKAGGMDTKKLVLLNLPYIFVGYFCDKVAWLWRVSEGTNASDKMMAVMNRFDKLFANPLLSFHPRDLLLGVAGGIALRLVVYYKAKNAKKFRQGVEYGSARWGNAKDIEPYMDSVFENNVLLTQAEQLMMPADRKSRSMQAEYENVVLKPSEYQQDMVASLAERAEAVRDRRVQPYEDNMLKITNDGRKLALDQRLLNDMLPDDENSKASTCVEKAFEIWEQTKEQKSTQLIFCDLSTPKGDGTFNVYEDIRNKLIEKGVPPEEIAFIHEANTELRKAELF